MGFARRGSNPLGVEYFFHAANILATKASFLKYHCSHYSLVVERQLCKLKVLGSIPSGGFYLKKKS